eukprot:GHRR01025910.1.p1 GENE.GHRR01025910.1~~GHRR01025910.1.p1  ORF type:complete len:118 (+),score=26.80 GHRR01025910.1:279-632(+)
MWSKTNVACYRSQASLMRPMADSLQHLNNLALQFVMRFLHISTWPSTLHVLYMLQYAFYVGCLQVSGADGAVLDWLMDPKGTHVSSVSAALEHDGKLFLGNLAGNYISYVQLNSTRQ